VSVKKLGVVACEVADCTACLLWKTRRNAAPGEGNPKATIMLVGEAPGRSEDVQGRPFVGAAGKFLETLLVEAGLSRADVFICNVLKCRPPQNRPPKPEEIKTCTPYLDRQMRAIKPTLIVTLGSFSTAYILSKAGLAFSGITEAHGKLYKANVLGRKVTVFPTLHPAAALYNPRYNEMLISDFKLLKHELLKIGISRRLSS
jgi:uracil-DNA glycosylase family 4